MANWLERARHEILKTRDRGTANAADRNLTSVTTVAYPGGFEISQVGSINHPHPRFTLIVTKSEPIPDAPISLNGWATVVNVKGFVDRTLADLEAYVAARNAGRWHWMESLLDETVEHLRLCGVEAEIREVQ